MGVLNTVRSGLNVLFTPVLYGVVASLAIQLATWQKGDITQDKMQDANEQSKVDTFDFIIVGGGTAGSVVANRLSEYYSVLVLEAGGEPNPLVYVPGLASHLVNRPEVDWMHKTVAQKRSSTLSQFKRSSWSGGKGLGGSGNLDFMMHLRGSPMDFDNWARLVGDKSWDYDHLLPYFQRHENFLGNTTDPEARAEGGELTIQLPDYRPLATEFVWAGKELGYHNVDLNGRFTEGFDELYYPIRRGEKQTTYKTFLETIKRRENLTIRKFATVTKLLLRKNDHGAYGLEYDRHGKKYTVYAHREIVLCAGAVESPKILLLSGIGPKRHLEDVGVKPIVNLPVGRNLQDHLAVYLGPFFIKEPLSFLFDRDVTANSFFQYGTFGKGPLTTTGFQATGLISSSFATRRGETGWPDLQLLLYGVSVHTNFATDMAHAYSLQEDVLKKYYKHAAGRHSFHIVVSLGRPYARGEIRLASRNPTAPLIIDPKYLEDPWEFDIKTMVEGVKKAVQVVEGTTKFQNLGGQFTHEVLPGCESVKFKSDEYWDCYVRQYTVSLHNPCGSCTMGPVNSPHAVVDSELKVLGSNNLRVVDASVMPSIPVGGTQSATIAIAEKGAEYILEYWKNKKPESHEQYDNKDILGQPKTTPKPVVVHTQTTTKPTKASLPPPPPPPPSPPTTTEQSITQAYKELDKLQQLPFTVNENHNWQNTLDSIAAFSKSIQHTFNLPTLAPPSTTTTLASTTTSSTTPSTTTTTTTAKLEPFTFPPPPRPILQVQSNLFRTHSPRVITAQTTKKPMKLPPKYVELSYHVVPTQQDTTMTPPATTFRPVETFNSTAAFSLHIPIIKGHYKHLSHQQPSPRPVKTYNAAPNKLIHNIIRKEQIYRPKPSYVVPTTIPTTTSTTPMTTTTKMPMTMFPTTYRPQIEIVHTQQIYPGYQHFVDIPITSVDYVNSRETGIESTPVVPTTTTTPSPPPLRSYNQIIPAINLPNPLETTTTRIVSVQPVPDQEANQQRIFLAGLEPIRLQDFTSTATALPLPTTSYVPPTLESVLQQQSSESAPIFYMVRKKNQHEEAHLQQHHQENRQRQQNHLRMRRPDLRPQRPFMRKTPPRNHHQGRRPRPPPPPQHHHSNHIMQSQATQRHFPVLALPPIFSRHQSQRLRHQQLQTTTGSDYHIHMASEPVHSVIVDPMSVRGGQRVIGSGDNEHTITRAISSPLFQQNVLNQLIPIQ